MSFLLKEHLRKIQKFTPERVERDLMQILQSEEKTAVNMVTDQMFQGKDSTGKKLPDYSENSVRLYNKQPGPWRLFDEGDFYKGVFMEVKKDQALFDSSDDKTGKIFDSLDSKGSNPDDLLGLNKENQTDLAQSYLREKTVKYFRDMLAV
jgi:hypothetical protein